MNKVLVIGDQHMFSRELINLLADKYEGIVQGEPLTAGQIPRVKKHAVAKSKNEWRGGSRGKGGKTKWPRR